MVEKLINNTLTSTEGFEDLYPFESNFMNINGNDLHYIDKGKGKPVIISTGMATHDDIELALGACRRMGNNDIALLKCTSSYPAPIEEANMVMVKDFAKGGEVETKREFIEVVNQVKEENEAFPNDMVNVMDSINAILQVSVKEVLKRS